MEMVFFLYGRVILYLMNYRYKANSRFIWWYERYTLGATDRPIDAADYGVVTRKQTTER